MFRPSDLEAFIDEALPVEEMTRIEKAVRNDPALAGQLASIHSRRESGVHSLGEIWRRRRLSCPSREQLESYLLGKLEKPHAAYVEFHIAAIGCRYCRANMADLQAQRAEAEPAVQSRRRKFFQSSAGYLRDSKM